MKLSGIIEEVFKGVTIFRGYTTLKNLASISKKSDYQREHDSQRFKDIQAYMSSSPFVFFPELIFGWQLEDIQTIMQIKAVKTIATITNHNIKFKIRSIANIDDSKIKILSIDIPDSIIAQPIFSRIDGNHRLSVIDSLMEQNNNSDSLLNMVVPYSVIIQTKNIESSKYEAAYFYLINSKAKPLTLNENLHAILEMNRFTKSEKENILSVNETQIELLDKVIEQLKKTSFEFINSVFNNEIYSFTLMLITELFEKNNCPLNQIDESVVKAIKYINGLYILEEIKFPNKDVLLALIIYKCRGNMSFTKFLEWINKNEMGTIEKLTFDNILKVYDNLHKKRSYKVFVAMPYISYKRVNEYNTLFREVFDNIENISKCKLELIPIMRFRGSAQRIDRRLIEMIKECDIFIADLTTCNDNVIFEVGLAEGNNKEMLLIKAEEDTEQLPFDEATKLDKGKRVPFDMDKLQYIPYSNSGYYNDIKRIMNRHLPVIIEKLANK